MSCFDEVSPQPFCKSIRLALALLLFEAMVGIIGLHHVMMNFTRIARAQIVHGLSCAAIQLSGATASCCLGAALAIALAAQSSRRPVQHKVTFQPIPTYVLVALGAVDAFHMFTITNLGPSSGPTVEVDGAALRMQNAAVMVFADWVPSVIHHTSSAPWNACYSFRSMTSSPPKSSSF